MSVSHATRYDMPYAIKTKQKAMTFDPAVKYMLLSLAVPHFSQRIIINNSSQHYILPNCQNNYHQLHKM
jgi:hypothetical protein